MGRSKIYCLFVLLWANLTVGQSIPGDDCWIDWNDSITQYQLRLFNLPDNYDNRIDAADLRNKQRLSFSCWLKYAEDNWGTVDVAGSKYKFFRRGKTYAEGYNEGSTFYFNGSMLDKLIGNTQVGDSILFYSFKTTVGSIKNVQVLNFSYKIVKNSIRQYDKNEIAGFKRISQIPQLDKLAALYPGCGNGDAFMSVDMPVYNENKTKVVYRFCFTRIEKTFDSSKGETN